MGRCIMTESYSLSFLMLKQNAPTKYYQGIDKLSISEPTNILEILGVSIEAGLLILDIMQELIPQCLMILELI